MNWEELKENFRKWIKKPTKCKLGFHKFYKAYVDNKNGQYYATLILECRRCKALRKYYFLKNN